MYKTKTECENRIRAIELELKKLQLERDYLIELKKIVPDITPQVGGPGRRFNTNTRQRVYDAIRFHPGSGHKELMEILNNELTPGQLTKAIGYLKSDRGLIENRGGPTNKARYYVKESST